ncbi:MAG: C10 family peptidase [Bacteroidaceae bacterium]|nr:C10 family peptidase [Bacteroidaceae bacterium]
MRHTLTLLIALVALSLHAEVRTPEQMRSLAVEALHQTGSSRLKAKANVESIQVLHDMNQLTLFGYPEAGWAIVSKDDSFTPVLGYSDEPIDMSNPSPEFLWLMETFSQGMERELVQPTSTRAKAPRKVSSALRAVQPLLKTNWDQGWPYNTKCPKVKLWSEKENKVVESDVVCGCVATALAQVFYHLQLPRKMQGSKTYTWANTKGVEGGYDTAHRLTYDYANNPFDWDNILPKYNGAESQKQVDAIGDLIYACGVLASMNYTPGSSGASLNATIAAVNNYCLDVRGIDYGYKMDLTAIARELNAGRPIIYAGGKEGEPSGHCFLIDGADAKGYLHCNMGWSGGGNGYYASDEMNNYPDYQQLAAVVPCEHVNVTIPMEELQGKSISADPTKPATKLETNKWYIMWNVGRSICTRDAGKTENVSAATFLPSATRSEYAGDLLVRLVPNTAGTRYYIQTSLGNYLPAFAHNTPAKPTTNKSAAYSITPITDKDGVLHEDTYSLVNANNVTLDCNGTNLLGWNTGVSTDPTGNSAWQFYPVELSTSAPITPMTNLQLTEQTIRMLVGEARPLSFTVAPAEATIPYVSWNSTKPAYATINQFGEIQGIAKGTSVISAASVDGSGLSSECTVYVGTSTLRKGLSNIRSTSVYTLRNTGSTDAYLLATDTTTLYPQMRGMRQRPTAAIAVKDQAYWEDAVLGDAYTQWQIIKSAYDENYYIYNVGMKKFLVNGGAESTPYIFSSAPSPVTLTRVTADDFTGAADFTNSFFINAGTTEKSRLMAHYGRFNPAQWLDEDSATRCKMATWEVYELSGVSTGLELLSVAELDAMLVPEGVKVNINDNVNDNISFDLTGRRVNNNARGIILQNGHKIIR